MLASKFVEIYGNELIGKWVNTEKMGLFPGGRAIVIDLGTDPNAPEIVMNVKADNWHEEIGVFDHEEINFWPEGGAPLLTMSQILIQ
jgi:hypothetical protein